MLEQEIAGFLGRRSAMVFPTGYQANLGVIAGLAGPKDTILLDSDSHASIYDGCRLSGATLIRFRHNSPADLDKRLGRLKDDKSSKLGIVEGIYSMLGRSEEHTSELTSLMRISYAVLRLTIKQTTNN